jgi:hypothetical protein
VAEIHEVTAEETHRAAHALLEPALAVGADSDAPLR